MLTPRAIQTKHTQRIPIRLQRFPKRAHTKSNHSWLNLAIGSWLAPETHESWVASSRAGAHLRQNKKPTPRRSRLEEGGNPRGDLWGVRCLSLCLARKPRHSTNRAPRSVIDQQQLSRSIFFTRLARLFYDAYLVTCCLADEYQNPCTEAYCFSQKVTTRLGYLSTV